MDRNCIPDKRVKNNEIEFLVRFPLNPGVGRERGHFGFAGHSDPVEFRNVRIKRLDGAGGWMALFDGETLSGWTQKNGTATYRVEDGAIVGRTTDGSPNSFLCTDRDYSDFELEFEVRVDNALNSGVQIRSRSLPEFKDGLVHGPQVEIEASPGEAGHVYSEGTGRGWLSPAAHRDDPALRGVFKNGRWNRYRVVAAGTRIRSWINGMALGDIDDRDSSRSGFIGLQVHSVPRGSGPFEVRWRNLQIRELPR